ncbi:MAG: aspartate kinase [Dethiobacteria bacterium]|nr:aspartate kinase [Dethiobacteria bacterium]
MALVIHKYGGTSVATLDHIRRVAMAVKLSAEKGNQVVVVVSAMSGQTDRLLGMAAEITATPNEREQDALVATGEQSCAALLAITLNSMGQKAKSFMGMQLPMVTDNLHTRAHIVDLPTTVLKQTIEEQCIPVVAGFQGVTEDGSITTLGRGGSDTTAVALAAALKADCCEIYTDVDGVYTADPNICPRARHLKRISYHEMLELAGLGAKVLHARSVELAQKYQVPLVVKSSFGGERETWIVNEEDVMENSIIKGVTLERNVSKISLIRVPDRPGVAYKILSPLADAAINVDMIIQNASIDGFADFTFTMPTTDLDKAITLVNAVAESIGALEVLADNNIVKVSAVGIGIKTNPGVAARMFKSLSSENINIQMISTSEYRISCVIEEKYGELAVRAVHHAFDLDDTEHHAIEE